MSTTNLLPPGRLAPARPPRDAWSRRRRGWTLAISILLHVLAVVGFLLVAKQPEGDEGSPAPSYQLMFESPDANVPPSTAGQPDFSTAPSPQPAPPSLPPPPPKPSTDALPGPESAEPTAVPAPDAPVVPPSPPTPPAPTQPVAPPEPAPPIATPSTPIPPAAPHAETPPAPTPSAPPVETTLAPEPTPLPAPSSPPQVRLEQPQDQPPPPPLVPDLVLPTPPPLPAAPPRPPPPQRPRTAPPQQQAGTFANPMDLNFGPSTNRGPAPRTTAPRGSVASRSLDLSPGAPKGPNRAEAFFDVRAARLGVDWQGALMSYWLSHRYYPRQAAEDGADGTVDLELTVDATGRVEKADLKSHSGNQFLDMAAIGTWRNAKLPPLPPELGDRYTFTITINYILIR